MSEHEDCCWNDGYAAGVIAAQVAVVDAANPLDLATLGRMLAAIDALKEKQ